MKSQNESITVFKQKFPKFGENQQCTDQKAL